MAKIVEMPKLSDTMEEGGIASWLKKEGDAVEEGEPLVEIETDKATMEYASPEGGILLKIVVPAGKGAALNAPIAVIGDKGEKFDLSQLNGTESKTGNHAGSAAAKAPARKTDDGEADASKAGGPAKPSAAPQPGKRAEPSPGPSAPRSAAGSGDRIKASPLAKKQAQELGINLAQIAGSGPGGRVVARDLAAMPAAEQPARGAPRASDGQDATIPLTMMRKTIAKRLTAAKNEAPHFYLTRSIDMKTALAWRERMNQSLAKKSGASALKVSVNDIIVMAAAKTLRRHPAVNASFAGDAIIQYGNVHVAVAVALPTGLVTPVIRHTDQMGILEIAQESNRLIQAAKAGNLGNEDYLGGTFTISNLGMFGIQEFTAIINPPQAAILAVGATETVPVIAEDGSVRAAQRMKVTMSCDHRAVDGAVGAQFLATLAECLEDPSMMLL